MLYDVGLEPKSESTSTAISVLDNLATGGVLKKREVEQFKKKYAKLQSCLVAANERNQRLLEEAKRLNVQLVKEGFHLEKTTLETQDDCGCLQQLEEELEVARSDVDVVKNRLLVLQVQWSELEKEKLDKQKQLDELAAERKTALEPKIFHLKEEIVLLTKELSIVRVQNETLQQRQADSRAHRQQMERELLASHEMLHDQELEQKKLGTELPRLRQQADKVETSVASQLQVRDEQLRVTEAANAEARKAAANRSQIENRRAELQAHIDELEVETREVAEAVDLAKTELDRRKNESTELVMVRVRLDAEIDEADGEHRQGLLEIGRLRREQENLKRRHRRSGSVKAASEEAIAALEAERDRLVQQRKARLPEEQKLRESQLEMHKGLGRLLLERAELEGISAEKREQLEALSARIEDAGREVRALEGEERQWRGHCGTLEAHLAKLSREVAAALRLGEDARDEVAALAMGEASLRKKLEEVKRKREEFSTMCEVVKSECTKYAFHIKRSQAHRVELENKYKLLQSEVLSLRMGRSSQDEQLKRVTLETDKLEARQARQENEKARASKQTLALNEQILQYALEIANLKATAYVIQEEALGVKRDCDLAVESRNAVGAQLIDKNDQLSVLWERSNLLEKLLRNGEEALRLRDEEIASLSLEAKEVDRQLLVARSRAPDSVGLADEASRLQNEIRSVMEKSAEISRELEDPSSSARQFRKLGGEDLDVAELGQKIRDLEERLQTKIEALLEKELVLEEVTCLSEKLQSQVAEGRQSALELSQKVNIFQARIQDATRKMMAAVSELSMLQSTARKLEAERDEVVERANLARIRMQQGLPPTYTANAEFGRLQQQEKQRELDRQAAAFARKQEAETFAFARSTAEPRINAYLSEDADNFGVPVPYGQLAPFKPAVPGSTMRHIRKPNTKPVDF